jgi:hypothetical protein
LANLPGRDSHPLDYTTLPGRTEDISYQPVQYVWNTRSTQLLQLIKFLDFFGFLETAIGPVGYAVPGTTDHERMKKEAALIKEKLTVRCIQELRDKLGA